MSGQGSQSTLVAVGFAEALAAPEVVWSLVDAGFRVVAFARQGRRAAIAHSRHVTVTEIPPPEVDVAAAKAALRDALEGVRAEGTATRHVLLPLDDAAVWLCGGLDNVGWILAGPGEADPRALALDKGYQIRAARDAGLAVPPSAIIRCAADVEQASLPLPLILRPAAAVTVADGRIRKGRNWICSDRSELADALAAWDGRGELLAQPYLRGTGEGLFGLATAGGVVAWSAHRRLRMMNPHGSGASACVSRSVDPALTEPVERMLATAGWRGLFMVELLRRPDGQAIFVEFNGRPWGSLALGRRQGFEYPAWAVRLALNEATDMTAEPREGLVCRHVARELMHLLFVLRGRQSAAVHQWPGLWSTLRDLAVVDRRSTLYNWRREDWRVFASDCYYTLASNLWKSGPV